MVKGRSNQNPPYEYMTEKKWDSLGQTLTIKQALDMWWNSICVRWIKNKTSCIFTIYKCSDGEYDIGDLADCLDIKEEDLLKCQITLDENYDEDADGYPIVFAHLLWNTKLF